MPLARASEPYGHWLYSDPARDDALRLVPERGGLLSGWRCDGQELLYFDAERFADPSLSVRGGVPVLFPICGNLPNDTLPLPQGDFHLSQHGFARTMAWQLEALEGPGTSGVRLQLRDDESSRARFPFAFRLELTYRLEPRALAITARVEHHSNPDSPPMPFSLGLHPYLAVSDPAAVAITGLPPRCLDHHTMAPDATESQLQHLGRGVDLLCQARGPVQLLDPAAGRAIRLETSPPFDLVVLWTEPPRPMVCLEPWTGPRGSLISGERRLELAAGASLELRARYEVSDL
jgi:galactose mutarotase-like enzyme